MSRANSMLGLKRVGVLARIHGDGSHVVSVPTLTQLARANVQQLVAPSSLIEARSSRHEARKVAIFPPE